jgi:hypothetical protein
MQFTSFCPDNSESNFRNSAVRSGCLIVVLLLGGVLFYFVPDAGAQIQTKQNGNLTLTIQPQIQLQEQGTNVILKIRLAQGTNARLWGDNSCGLPKDNGTIVTVSGTYTISVQNLAGQGQAYACAASSDDILKASIPLQN